MYKHIPLLKYYLTTEYFGIEIIVPYFRPKIDFCVLIINSLAYHLVNEECRQFRIDSLRETLFLNNKRIDMNSSCKNGGARDFRQ